VYFGLSGRTISSFTGELRNGSRTFTLTSPDPSRRPSSPSPNSSPGAFFTITSALRSAFVSPPQVTPLFNGFASSINSSVPLLLAVAHPELSLSEFSAAIDVSGASSQNPTDEKRNLLDEIFGEWESFKRVFVDKADLKDGDPAESSLHTSRFGRAWAAVLDAVDSWFTSNTAGAPAEHSGRPQGSNDPSESRKYEVSKPSANEVNDNTNAAPSATPKRASLPQSDAQSPQPVSADAESQREDPSHAAAA